MCASDFLNVITQKTSQIYVWIILLWVILPPNYAISLHFSVFHGGFCVDCLCSKLLLVQSEILKKLQVNKSLRYQSSIKASSCCHWVSLTCRDTLKTFKKDAWRYLSKVTVLNLKGNIHIKYPLLESNSMLLSSEEDAGMCLSTTFKLAFICQEIEEKQLSCMGFTLSFGMLDSRPHSKNCNLYDKNPATSGLVLLFCHLSLSEKAGKIWG